MSESAQVAQRTTVVNYRHGKKYDVSIMRPGLFGNPYPFGLGPGRDRGGVLEDFTAYFARRLNMDQEFFAAVKALKGKRLGCVCRPKAGFQGKVLCHGQIIAGYLDGVPAREIE